MTTFSLTWHGRAVGINQRYAIRRPGGRGPARIARSSAYRSFVHNLTTSLTNAHPPRHLPPPVTVTITQKSAHDIDALAKAVLDALQDAHILIDDRDVHHLHISKLPGKRGHASISITASSP